MPDPVVMNLYRCCFRSRLIHRKRIREGRAQCISRQILVGCFIGIVGISLEGDGIRPHIISGCPGGRFHRILRHRISRQILCGNHKGRGLHALVKVVLVHREGGCHLFKVISLMGGALDIRGVAYRHHRPNLVHHEIHSCHGCRGRRENFRRKVCRRGILIDKISCRRGKTVVRRIRNRHGMNGVGGISLKGNFQLIRSVIGIGPQRPFALRICLPVEIHGVAALEVNDIRFHQIIQRVCMANAFHRQIHGYSCRIKVSFPEGNHCLSVSVEIPSVFRIISVISDGNGGCRHVDGKFRGSVRDGLVGQDISGPVHSVELHIEAVAVVGGRDGDASGETFCSYEFAVGLRTYHPVCNLCILLCFINRISILQNVVLVIQLIIVKIFHNVVNIFQTGIFHTVIIIRILNINLKQYITVVYATFCLMNTSSCLRINSKRNLVPDRSHIVQNKTVGAVISHISRIVCRFGIDNISAVGIPHTGFDDGFHRGSSFLVLYPGKLFPFIFGNQLFFGNYFIQNYIFQRFHTGGRIASLHGNLLGFA